ncbi:MAG TPA: cell envelope integrity protein TolA [Candidatus Binatia bacterium]|jgi:colicin import membrane protein|nr:cell envelope integrity protein TolA [Candidatus Binatia bacterium]
MTPRKPGGSRERQEDNSLSRMVVLSAVLHLIVITAIVVTATRNWSGRPAQVAYTVNLVDPAALGTNLPDGGGEKPTPARARPAPEVKEPPAVKNETAKVTQPPQPKEVKEPPVAKKEEPKAQPAKEKEAVKLPDKEKPVEKLPPKPETEKKAEEKKPEAKKPEVKPQPQPAAAKPEEKKSEPVKAETPPSAEERDKQIASAIEKIKGKVQGKEKDSAGNQPGGSSSPVSGSGPTTLGGAPGQGGDGIVRGLEFIMYTEQVKRRVKESWIVTEKKPGLTATVRFGVQPDGEVFAIELVKRSGDRAFDESVVRAVNKANPLPPPPQTYQQEFATQKVEVIFGGEERTN